MRTSAIHVACVLALVSCGGGALTPAPNDPTQAPDLTLDDPTRKTPMDPEKVAAALADVRGLEVRSPIVAVALDDAAFRARLATHVHASRSSRGAQTNAFWYGFGFARPTVKVADVSRRVMAETVVGFYDSVEKKLFVRATTSDGRVPIMASKDRLTLVHEIEHALQDQAFTMPDDSGLDDDQRLAVSAVYEGDAMLTTLAYDAVKRPSVSEHWVSRVTRFVRAMTLEQLVKMGEHSEELMSAPPLMQRRHLFPYVEGMAFAADVYRAGGLPLLNRVFAKPPVSTEQVLHPEKYLAGELPVPVQAPSAPQGYRVLTTGKMGELQTSMLLAQCAGAEVARAASRDWGGDAYAIVVGPSEKVSLLWATAWDHADAAQRFAAAARARGACFAKDQSMLAPSIERDVTVVVDGTRVAYVQGLAEAEREPAARALLALAGAAPAASPPLGDVKVPRLVDPEREFLRRGAYARGRYVSVPLGIVAPVPRGFTTLSSGEGLEMLMRRTKPLGVAGVGFVFASPGQRLEQQFLKKALEDLRASKTFQGQEFVYRGEGALDVGGARAAAYTWAIGEQLRLRIAFVPACERRATAVVTMLWSDGDDGWEPLERWVATIKLDPTSPACVYSRTALD